MTKQNKPVKPVVKAVEKITVTSKVEKTNKDFPSTPAGLQMNNEAGFCSVKFFSVNRCSGKVSKRIGAFNFCESCYNHQMAKVEANKSKEKRQ